MSKGTVNKVILIGRLGETPEVKFMPNGNALARFSLATNDSYNDKQTGQKIESTEWHKVSFFGKAAEVLGEYGKKGGLLYVEGQLKTRKWQDSNGQDRYMTEIKGREFQFVGAGGGDNHQAQYASNPKPVNPSNISSAGVPNTAPTLSELDKGNDEIPF